MPSTLAQKLRIKEGSVLLTLNAPKNFEKSLGNLPADVEITTTGKQFNQVHWFVLNRAQMEKQINKVLKLLKPEVTVWMYYPKGTSGIQTDLTRDKGWDCLLAEGDKLTWISLISFDAMWSVFGFRPKTAADKKKEATPKVREIFNWVNPTTKEVKLPDDLAGALKKNKKANEFFQALSFTNKKEYIEWIVTAKQEKTRTERVEGTIERLGKQWKNPRNL
ncbi:bacteriocin resistance YdeI/OmpD-like protein [Lacibacter cauensis]|uniref:Bacteriocin resistance YdeI/OmpD-like protein n=1 Tax=Lacibacter cauensis TaxID=510947 RepID=A0A562SRT8_9BACT|nr:YdeI/OmpD-associated family protein [Lacibacter cauensis]TWI83853.1 bacteriocin resistance YdeI/OmpD-like protein [Lacibacter cauensis]